MVWSGRAHQCIKCRIAIRCQIGKSHRTLIPSLWRVAKETPIPNPYLGNLKEQYERQKHALFQEIAGPLSIKSEIKPKSKKKSSASYILEGSAISKESPSPDDQESSRKRREDKGRKGYLGTGCHALLKAERRPGNRGASQILI